MESVFGVWGKIFKVFEGLTSEASPLQGDITIPLTCMLLGKSIPKERVAFYGYYRSTVEKG